MTRSLQRLLALAAVGALVTSVNAFASNKDRDKAVPTLAGHVFVPPPPATASSPDAIHIHLTAQDLYKEPPPVVSASGAASTTNVWGAAGAGKGPLVASGPPAVYTTMAAAAAAGVEPFKKPEPAQTASSSTKRTALQSFRGWKLYALVAAVLGFILGGMVYVRRRRNDGD